MIDKLLLRQDPVKIGAKIQKKDPAFPIEQLLKLDEQVRALLVSVESLRKEKNDLAQQARGGITQALRDRSIEVGKFLKEQEAQLEVAELALKKLELTCPNLPFDEVPEGNKAENVVVRQYGQKPAFSFEPKHHLELGQINNWFNLEAAATMAASNFVFYRGQAAKLVYALAMFMVKHNSKHGFEVTLPPALVNDETLTVSGNFPKFKDDVFAVSQDGLYLIPTSEVALANLYRDQILAIDQLPIRLTSWTSCFRREAGNYGRNERGLIRIHQFEKVELFSICEPEKSGQELEMMVNCAEEILKALGLHYRVSLLAAQDCSFQSSKTYDIEVWLPGQKQYYEVSSASNCSDFQARRGKIRYRANATEKTQYVHTLNASSLALPRLMVALMETYQKEDGTIELPEVLKKELW